MVPLNVIYQIPLLPIRRVTIDAIELLDVTMDVLLVGLHCSLSGEQLSANVTRKVSLTHMNNVDVILERLVVLINVPTHMTRESLLFLILIRPFTRVTRFAFVMFEVVFVLVRFPTFQAVVLKSCVLPLVSVH